MDKNQIHEQYQRWLENAIVDNDLKDELLNMVENESKLEDAFYRDLAFGTGGLRGVIGAGPNRMNIHTVSKVTQGLANFVLSHFKRGSRKVAIGYDCRIKSELFAKVASCVFAANGIEVFLYPELIPTPCLSYAVRDLKCSVGIMITASHNPAKYNGYKVYGADGCQITTDAAIEISTEIDRIDYFKGIKTINFEIAVLKKRICYIPESLIINFISEVRKQSLLSSEEIIDRDLKIVYSPLNGTGLNPVLRILKESGFNNVIVVKEQELPDGNFPTCPNPNPEIQETMELGIEYAKSNNADIFLATDPDCDRVGIAVRNENEEFVLISGNETGILLLDFICSQRLATSTMPLNPIIVKTIVTTDLAERIAADYGVKTINVLTGFKYIGEQIGNLEDKGIIESYIFGFEESYGYLTGTYVRDKDAVDGVFMICEMFAFYKSKGLSLLGQLDRLYEKYGYSLNSLHSFDFNGLVGFKKMESIMENLRNGIHVLGGVTIERVFDYQKGIDDLPKSNVLKFFLVDKSTIVVRPSGTEPKLKIYLSINALSKAEAQDEEVVIINFFKNLFKS